MAMPKEKLPKPVKYLIETLNADGTVAATHYAGNNKADAKVAFDTFPTSQAFQKVGAGGFHRKVQK